MAPGLVVGGSTRNIRVEMSAEVAREAMKERSVKLWWAMALFVVVIAGGWTAARGATIGFWEPWESAVVLAAQDADEAGLPRQGDEVVGLSYLKTGLAALSASDLPVVESGDVGTQERRSRRGLLAVWLIFVAAVALWMRRQAGEGAAAMTAVVVATAPAFYLGATFLSGPLIYVAASALCVMAFFESAKATGRGRITWALLSGLALSVVAFDERLIGVYATVAVLVAQALAQAVDEEQREEVAGLDFGALIAGVLFAGGALFWGVKQSAEFEGSIFSPEVVEKLWLIVPVALILGLALAGRRSEFGRTLLGPAGLIVAFLGAAPLLWLSRLEGAGLTYLLENVTIAEELSVAGNYAWWWRQVGFGLFPHTLFLVPALGFLAWKLRLQEKGDGGQRDLAMLFLVWPAASFVVVVPAQGLGHSVFPALFPFAAAIGWMVASSDFWKRLRLEPMAYLAMGLIAIFAVMVLAKDFENFPTRLVEFVLGGEEGLGLGEDYEYGRELKLWKYGLVALIGAYFAGVISWVVFALRDLKVLKGWIGGQWRRWRKKESAPSVDAKKVDEGVIAGQERLAKREVWRSQEGLLPRIARVLEEGPGRAMLVSLAGLSFLALTYTELAPDLDERLSTRGVVEAYLRLADDGEELVRYQLPQAQGSFYIQGIEEVEGRRAFEELYARDERLFALIPQEKQAAIHSAVRQAQGENMPVIESTGGLVLISNRLKEGEVDRSEISKYIVPELDEEEYIPIQVEEGERDVHPSFGRQIELVGYRLDRGDEEERATYTWGDEVEIVMYFRVLRRIPREQTIFIHIDRPGSRLPGDHEPAGGVYPTNHWVRGDVIRDVHRVEVPRFASPGTYTIWAGFYRGDNRMEVWPEGAHDGQNRVKVATIEVGAF